MKDKGKKSIEVLDEVHIREEIAKEIRANFQGLTFLEVDIDELVRKVREDPKYFKKLSIKKELKEFQTRKVKPTTIGKIENGSKEYDELLENMRRQNPDKILPDEEVKEDVTEAV